MSKTQTASHSVLEVALAHGDRAFVPAFEKLMEQISTERALELFAEMTAQMKALQDGVPFSPSIALDACGALALLHVTTGIPLRLDDALLQAWATSGGSTHECENSDCRYRQPAGYAPLCVVCGGVMSEPGSFWDRSVLSKADTDQLRLLASTATTLANQLSPDRRVHLLRDIDKGVRAKLAGVEIPKSMVAGVALVITHQYLTIRTPLFLSDELFDRWTAAEHTGCEECVACGYRGMLEGDPACVLCGGATGVPGAFAAARKRRAAVAGWN